MATRAFSTDRELKALKPAVKWYDVKDEKARNLIVRVGPMNTKNEFRRTFCIVTRFPGSKNPTRHALGEYRVDNKGDLTLEEAREKAGEWRKLDSPEHRSQGGRAARERGDRPQARSDLRRRD